jgi:hypothetical protein
MKANLLISCVGGVAGRVEQVARGLCCYNSWNNNFSFFDIIAPELRSRCESDGKKLISTNGRRSSNQIELD